VSKPPKTSTVLKRAPALAAAIGETAQAAGIVGDRIPALVAALRQTGQSVAKLRQNQ
jgi:hypothetical protein